MKRTIFILIRLRNNAQEFANVFTSEKEIDKKIIELEAKNKDLTFFKIEKEIEFEEEKENFRVHQFNQLQDLKEKVKNKLEEQGFIDYQEKDEVIVLEVQEIFEEKDLRWALFINFLWDASKQEYFLTFESNNDNLKKQIKGLFDDEN